MDLGWFICKSAYDLQKEQTLSQGIQLIVSYAEKQSKDLNVLNRVVFLPDKNKTTIRVFMKSGKQDFDFEISKSGAKELLGIFGKVIFSSILHEIKNKLQENTSNTSNTSHVKIYGKVGKFKTFLYHFCFEIDTKNIIHYKEIELHKEEFKEFMNVLKFCLCAR